MIRHLCLVILSTAISFSLGHAQQSDQIDSLLAMHKYSDALSLVDAVSASHNERFRGDVRSLINNVRNIESLSDSVLGTRLQRASTISKDYDGVNAGNRAASAYDDFRKAYDLKTTRTAYESLLLAQHFRAQHLTRERARLRSNIAMAALYVKKEEFVKAEELLELYKKEPRTSAFITLEDTLRFAYNWMEPQIELGAAKHETQLGRTSVTKKFYINLAGGLNPHMKLDKDQLLLREFETDEYAVWDLPANSVNTVVPVFGLEAGYYFSSRTSIGVAYSRSSSTFRNGILISQTSFSYRARIEYTRADVLLVHRLSDKTGPRPYLAGGLGLTTSSLSSLEDSGAFHTFHVKPFSNDGWHVALGGGTEYIFSDSFPLVLSAGAMIFINSGSSEILNSFNFEISVSAGVVL